MSASFCPHYEDFFHVPGVRNILSCRDRFFELKKYVYFCDPEHVLIEEEKRLDVSITLPF